MSYSGIYAIYQASQERYVYVGSSVDIKRRVSSHKSGLRHGKHDNSYLQRVWNKYGAGDFFFIGVEECLEHSLIAREQYWADVLKPVCNRGAYVDNPTRGVQKTEKQMQVSLTAGRKNLMLGTIAAAKKPITDKQREARRRNIARATQISAALPRSDKQHKWAVESGQRMADLPKTEKQLQAALNNLEKARGE